MASKLFHSVVVSSSLLLSTGCASVVVAGDPDASIDASSVDGASTADAADVLAHDARFREAGWPTTKGSFCEHPEAGPSFCCGFNVPGDGPGQRCCIPDPFDDERCTPCTQTDGGQCVPHDGGR
jgi:hypothetical protein